MTCLLHLVEPVEPYEVIESDSIDFSVFTRFPPKCTSNTALISFVHEMISETDDFCITCWNWCLFWTALVSNLSLPKVLVYTKQRRWSVPCQAKSWETSNGSENFRLKKTHFIFVKPWCNVSKLHILSLHKCSHIQNIPKVNKMSERVQCIGPILCCHFWIA